MSERNNDTYERILNAAKEEFLKKGYHSASLRNITKNACVTTGSLYWYFKSKKELFDAIVSVHYHRILDLYDKARNKVFDFSYNKSDEAVNEVGSNCFMEMLDYMYLHISEFRIIISGAEGTEYDDIVHALVMREIESSEKFIGTVSDKEEAISPELAYIVVSGMFSGLFEMIKHYYSLSKAKKCIKELYDFYAAGFSYIMNSS